ncbi:NAD-dependent epimerase/dehydratase family protein [Microbacterium laevaniformans]|uniref:NAD-dependent epimerase/dehydratase family protein n=1 Tax=Microbacterium laevaniformans TaxID=36807 RepID=A0A4V3RJQ2_9MICO|nr:NAD(P)H-binding protein [Microbacterium laevaniformans]TGY36800.1 NAD-dependent epimerase/dehydratase family protein [Microbacterium laevaniformans]
MARILIIGGHGKVALQAEPLLVRAGHDVRAVIRNADHADDVAAAGAHPEVADVAGLDIAQLTDLVRGSDVVIWSAGAGGGDAARTYAVDRDAAIRTIDAAVAAGVDRFIMVSYFGAGADHGVDPHNGFFAYAEAKAAADDHLRASGVDFTILAPSSLTDDAATGLIETDAESGTSVSRADVAAVLAAAVDQPATRGRTVSFNTGSTPIAAALAAA